jgi:hypothetical protein
MLRAARVNDISDIGTEDTVTARLARYAATEITLAPFPAPEDLGAIERAIHPTAELSSTR